MVGARHFLLSDNDGTFMHLVWNVASIGRLALFCFAPLPVLGVELVGYRSLTKLLLVQTSSFIDTAGQVRYTATMPSRTNRLI
jgi:hypothetical protein